MFMLFSASGIGMVYLSMLGAGASFIGMYYSCATFINNEMEEDMKSTGQSMLAFFQIGLGSILGNTLGGYIAEFYGMRYTFLFYGICLGVVCIICTGVFSVIRLRKAG
jgi:MFS family permease